MMTICLHQNKVSHGTAVVILSHGPYFFTVIVVLTTRSYSVSFRI
jgi:hypothetical protein